MKEARDRDEPEHRLTGPQKVERIVSAFGYPPMTETERLIIQVLLDHPGQSSAFLTSKCGWQGQSWHMHFGLMCSRRQHQLWRAEIEPGLRRPFYTGILADYDGNTSGFTLKPEAVEAFRRLGLEPALSSQKERGNPSPLGERQG